MCLRFETMINFMFNVVDVLNSHWTMPNNFETMCTSDKNSDNGYIVSDYKTDTDQSTCKF